MEFHPVVDRDSPAALAEAHHSSPWLQHPGVPCRAGQQARALTKEQLAAYDRDGFLLIKAKDVWTPAEHKLIIASVNAMGDWPDAKGKWMKVSSSRARPHAAPSAQHQAARTDACHCHQVGSHGHHAAAVAAAAAVCNQYYETNRNDPSGPKLMSRIENFTQYNPGLDFLLTGDKLVRQQANTHMHTDAATASDTRPRRPSEWGSAFECSAALCRAPPVCTVFFPVTCA